MKVNEVKGHGYKIGHNTVNRLKTCSKLLNQLDHSKYNIDNLERIM